jgi:hypothetical protein
MSDKRRPTFFVRRSIDLARAVLAGHSDLAQEIARQLLEKAPKRLAMDVDSADGNSCVPRTEQSHTSVGI